MKKNWGALSIKHRVLVTGSRGKSSLVRMISAGLCALGLDVRARITGVLPRELYRGGTRRIVRNAPAHVAEMRWWLGQIPEGTDAAVMENAAVNPDLQRLAAEWLNPTLTVWTNARADHQDLWGDGRRCAEAALLRGIPDSGVLVISEELSSSAALMEKLKRRKEPPVIAPGAEGFFASNLALAMAAIESIGLGGEAARLAIESLPPDVADFRVFDIAGALLAAAFSANDPESTEMLFSSLGWSVEETSLLYSDRKDRPARLRCFEPFMRRPWREVRVLKGRESAAEVAEWAAGKNEKSNKKIFGCGNVAGVPLEMLEELVRSGCPWTIPGV